MAKFYDNPPKPVILMILDGWGYSNSNTYNAISQANTPCWDKLIKNYPNTQLLTSGKEVGLPNGQMGNSEVGHMTIGSGRIIWQDLEKINKSITEGELKSNPELINLAKQTIIKKGVCHLLGLASDGGVHSHINHIKKLALYLASYGVKVNLHLFLDGRDTIPETGIEFVKEIDMFCKQTFPFLISIATITGRYYAMDRDKNWERTKIAYDAITLAEGFKTKDVIETIKYNYELGKIDEFMMPVINDNYFGMNNNDSILMANFRADRVIQILQSLAIPTFNEFKRKKIINFSYYLGMSTYSSELSVFIKSLFQKEKVKNTLGEVVANANKKQLRIAETEKFAHVTYFFNAGNEKQYQNEDRILVKSPLVSTYDQKPEMAAFEVTDKVIEAIKHDKYDLIILNFANADMVGHTGNLKATIRAIETIDTCLEKIINIVNEKKGVAVITADHGNAELMYDEKIKKSITSHTLNPVPFLLVGKNIDKNQISLYQGSLKDVAPTILEIMGLLRPINMEGMSLINIKNENEY